jgi:hypothetical protein
MGWHHHDPDTSPILRISVFLTVALGGVAVLAYGVIPLAEDNLVLGGLSLLPTVPVLLVGLQVIWMRLEGKA